MKKAGHFILLSCWLLSCGSDQAAKERKPGVDTVATQQPVDTPTPKADTLPPVEQPIVLNDIPRTREVNELLKYFIEKYSVNYEEIHPVELKVYVLDRFSCDKKYKVYLQKKIPVEHKKEKVFPVAELHAYIYKDSAQCANAVNNWMNCFGNSCEMIKPGQNLTVSSSPGLYILNEKNIVCLDHRPGHAKNNWKSMYADLKKLFVTKKSQVIEVRPHGELVWVQ